MTTADRKVLYLGDEKSHLRKRLNDLLAPAYHLNSGGTRLESAHEDVGISAIILAADNTALVSSLARQCRHLRETDKTIPILVVLSDADVEPEIEIWRSGADTCIYIDKINPDRIRSYLHLRLSALIERNRKLNACLRKQDSKDSAEDVVLCEARHEVQWKGRKIRLSETQFKMLGVLCDKNGALVSFKEFSETVHTTIETNTISAHIKSIRKAFKAADPNFSAIRSERCRGYRWVA